MRNKQNNSLKKYFIAEIFRFEFLILLIIKHGKNLEQKGKSKE